MLAQPSSLVRAVNSETLSVGAYASSPTSFLRSFTAWEALAALPPTPRTKSLPFLARVSASPALADDLAQESYVRFLSAARPEQLLAEGEVAARRYLFRIATNLLRDHWRKPQHSSIEELPEEFRRLDLGTTGFRLLLVIKTAKESWLPPLNDALKVALHATVKTWALGPNAVAVLTEDGARQYGLIVA